jgi:hypothetical protein
MTVLHARLNKMVKERCWKGNMLRIDVELPTTGGVSRVFKKIKITKTISVLFVDGTKGKQASPRRKPTMMLHLFVLLMELRDHRITSHIRQDEGATGVALAGQCEQQLEDSAVRELRTPVAQQTGCTMAVNVVAVIRTTKIC